MLPTVIGKFVAIRKLRPGTYHGEAVFDVPGGEIITRTAASSHRGALWVKTAIFREQLRLQRRSESMRAFRSIDSASYSPKDTL